MPTTEAIPVAVYDVEKQKLAFVFRSRISAILHLFQDAQLKGTNGYTSLMKYWIDNKVRKESDTVNLTLAFRNASEEQMRELGGDILKCYNGYELQVLRKYTSIGIRSQADSEAPPRPRGERIEEMAKLPWDKIKERLQAGERKEDIMEEFNIPQHYFNQYIPSVTNLKKGTERAFKREQRPPQFVVTYKVRGISSLDSSSYTHLAPDGIKTFCGKRVKGILKVKSVVPYIAGEVEITCKNCSKHSAN